MKLRLVYPHDRVSVPVLSETVLKTGVLLNILEAKVTPRTGEVVVDVPARGKQLDEVIRRFEKAGVNVEKITGAVQVDSDVCISCGACVSPCPVQAVEQNPDWSVQIDEAKCVRCMVCVDACPVRAISSP